MRNFKKILSLILVAAISTSNVNVAFADYRGVLDYDISSNENSKIMAMLLYTMTA